MTYDKARHQAVLFAGDRALIVEPGQTWVFEGTLWIQKFPANNPRAFLYHRMTFDERRGTVVLFGYEGRGPYGSLWLVVWEWDGTDWREVPRIGSWPSSRNGFGLAYDSRRGRHIVFGGALSHEEQPIYTDTAETWEFDAVLGWWELRSTSGPPAGPPGGMTFDGARATTVLTGGAAGEQTWIWNGDIWSQHAARFPVGAVGAVQMVYDELNKVVWVFDAGHRGYSYHDRTWAWDGMDYRCRPGSFLEPICTEEIRGTPDLLIFEWQVAPAAYDSDRLRVVALGDFSRAPRSYFLARGNRQPINFVNWSNPNLPGDGTSADPFLTVQEAIPCLTDGSTLNIQGGTYQEVGPITLRRRVTIVPLNGSVTIR